MLLLDEGIPLRSAKLLAARQIRAEHVRTLGMGGQRDEQLIAWALANDAAIVTFDSDFHRWLAKNHATKPSVIRVRIDGLKAEPMTQLLEQVVHQTSDELKAGAVVSITTHMVGTRRLPLSTAPA